MFKQIGFKQIGMVIFSAAFVAATASSSAQANSADWDEFDQLWQLEQLFEPVASQRRREQRGGINIYSDLKDSVVERAMDEQFDRIENMMFVRTISTDADGEVLMTTGSDGELVAVVEEDGC